MIREDDRGLLLGDGVFDTLRVEDGRLLLFRRHLERLLSACEALGIDVREDELGRSMRRAAAEAGAGAFTLRTTVTRGSGRRGLLPSGEEVPRVLIRLSPAGPRTGSPRRVVISDIRRNEGSPISSLKTLGYLDNVLARKRADEEGAEDAIMLTNRREPACTTVGNLLLLDERGWITPPLSGGGILPGTVRAVLVEAAVLREAPVSEGMLRAYPLARANSLVGVEPIFLEDGTEPDPSAAGRLTQVLEEAESRER